jgi:hypothetical protein
VNVARDIFDLAEILYLVLMRHRHGQSAGLLGAVSVPEPIIAPAGQFGRWRRIFVERRLFNDEQTAVQCHSRAPGKRSRLIAAPARGKIARRQDREESRRPLQPCRDLIGQGVIAAEVIGIEPHREVFVPTDLLGELVLEMPD